MKSDLHYNLYDFIVIHDNTDLSLHLLNIYSHHFSLLHPHITKFMKKIPIYRSNTERSESKI
jgi:hypothetical protein